MPITINENYNLEKARVLDAIKEPSPYKHPAKWKRRTNLTKPSKAYKPFLYPWANDYWAKQQQMHWVPEEIQFGEDVKDWRSLSSKERNFLTHIFRFFTQADVDIHDGYLDLYIPIFKNGEIRRMLTAFAAMETIHITAYARVIETLSMPDIEFSRFLEYDEMKEKHNFLRSFSMNNELEVLKTIAAFAAFTEGLQLFASFAMLFNFPRTGKMQGMGTVVEWSIKDETLHCLGMIKLFHQFAEDLGIDVKVIERDILDIALTTVSLEDKFIDLAFSEGDLPGLAKADLKAYVRFICNWRLEQLGLNALYKKTAHPLPWLISLTESVSHTNFFELRATEYSKGASTGTWDNAFLAL